MDLCRARTWCGCITTPMFLSSPPVWNEAFGVTPLEAMAAGVPVAVSRCGGIVETVQDQVTGFIVAPDDAGFPGGSHASLVENDSLRERMGRAGRRQALEFNWDIVNSGMLARYGALLQTNPQESGSRQNNLVSGGLIMIITRSPLRILGGGGTDLPSYYESYGGFLIAAAIDRYILYHDSRYVSTGIHHQVFPPGAGQYDQHDRASHHSRSAQVD